MKVAGTALLQAAPDQVLDAARDPALLVEALPNVGALDWEPHEGGGFAATIRPATALGELPIRTVWQPQSIGPSALGYRVEGSTGEHRVQLDVTLALRATDTGAAADWTVAFEVSGTMRSAGQRTITAIVDAQACLVLEALGTVAARSPQSLPAHEAAHRPVTAAVGAILRKYQNDFVSSHRR